jgi:hypothetical protein
MCVAECRRDVGLVLKLGICPGWSSPVSWDERLVDVPQKYGLLRSQGTIHEMQNWNGKSPKGIPERDPAWHPGTKAHGKRGLRNRELTGGVMCEETGRCTSPRTIPVDGWRVTA